MTYAKQMLDAHPRGGHPARPAELWAALLRLRVAGQRGNHTAMKEAADRLLALGPDAGTRLIASHALFDAGHFAEAQEVHQGITNDATSAPPLVRSDAYGALLRTLAERDLWPELEAQWEAWKGFVEASLPRPDVRVGSWQVRVANWRRQVA